MITLEDFVVLKQLSVKNITIEPKKVKATYEVQTFKGDVSNFDLIYSYDLAYFDKKSSSNANLASMMLAQVALNYGLFFQTIVFDGLYDKIDKRFLIDMLENTSREVLTNKLLIKNEFLKPEFCNLKPEKRSKYTQAKIEFVNTKFTNLKVVKESVQTDKSKYAILSSGGKDSLLTYGIVKELGEPFPIFINESGRHWFTAVNAYRHYKEVESNTSKPWTNCDRAFNWMLKQLPFIKENYASIRSDIYPVRLWTVAVFLFGTLPIVRSKNIANILIGDEYDTTVVSHNNGITHYNGLYDQSKYFDNALTRYFTSKGYNIFQFSLLRSLSELLIMKTLIKRYPDLQQHQVSCHAAHEVNGRMYPCGKCEKCRRIIGMLKALDENPERCGYSNKQIENGLRALENQSVKQIGPDAAHLYFLMVEKGVVEKNAFTKKLAKAHPSITKLRFDSERSNLEDLPEYVRKPLFNILKEYADGAVRRNIHIWENIEMNDEFIYQSPYKFSVK